MLRWLHDETIRPYLPRKVIVHNGVPARTGRLLDQKDHLMQWEAMLLAAIRNQHLEDSKIIEIGGGFGICTAELAKLAGPDGSVISYEADTDRIEIMNETLELNCVRDSVDIRNQFANSVDEECDVLVLDCEGTEREILVDGDYRNPETVIVETHPVFDVPTEDIQTALETDGYEISKVREGSKIDIIEAHL